MFTKIYLTITIVLCCYKKCSNFLWYFDDNSLIGSFQDKNYVYLFLRCPFSSLKLLIGFLLNALFSGGLKIFLQKHSCFFFTSKKIKYQSNLAASFDLAVTNRGIIIYTGNYTFPIAIMSVFMTKLYMQHLHSSFWFLTSYKRQLSNKRAPPSYERLTSKCSFYYKPA